MGRRETSQMPSKLARDSVSLSQHRFHHVQSSNLVMNLLASLAWNNVQHFPQSLGSQKDEIRIPFDLIYLILSFVDDIQSNLACTLVCHSWTSIARSHLLCCKRPNTGSLNYTGFETLQPKLPSLSSEQFSLDLDSDNVELFLSLIESPYSTLRFLRVTSIRLSPYAVFSRVHKPLIKSMFTSTVRSVFRTPKKCSMGADPSYCNRYVADGKISRVLSWRDDEGKPLPGIFPQLTSLSLQWSSWSNLTSEDATLLHSYTSLKSLRIWNIRHMTIRMLNDVIFNLMALERIELGPGVHREPSPIVIMHPRVHPNLRELALLDVSSSLMYFFTHCVGYAKGITNIDIIYNSPLNYQSHVQELIDLAGSSLTMFRLKHKREMFDLEHPIKLSFSNTPAINYVHFDLVQLLESPSSLLHLKALKHLEIDVGDLEKVDVADWSCLDQVLTRIESSRGVIRRKLAWNVVVNGGEEKALGEQVLGERVRNLIYVGLPQTVECWDVQIIISH